MHTHTPGKLSYTRIATRARAPVDDDDDAGAAGVLGSLRTEPSDGPARGVAGRFVCMCAVFVGSEPITSGAISKFNLNIGAHEPLRARDCARRRLRANNVLRCQFMVRNRVVRKS